MSKVDAATERLYLSEDGANTWERTGDGLSGELTPNGIVFDPTVPNLAFVFDYVDPAAAASGDGGHTRSRCTLAPPEDSRGEPLIDSHGRLHLGTMFKGAFSIDVAALAASCGLAAD